jgi:acetyl esterase/lipase
MNLLTVVSRGLGLFGEGRSPAALLNVTVPRRGYRVDRDIAYGAGQRQRLDLYLPARRPPLVLPQPPDSHFAASGASPGFCRARLDSGALGSSPARCWVSGAPVVVFFYGGAFRAGRKSEYRFAGEAFASAGMIVAVPDYRIYPEARFPDFLKDGAQAVAKVRDIAAVRGGDPERLFVAGHSAGAYIAVMLAANDAWLHAQCGDSSWIRGVIALSGRYHDSPLQDEIANMIFAGPPRDETRPASFIRERCSPMMLAAGSRESGVVLASKQSLARHLRRIGSEVEEVLYPGIGHAGIVAALAPGFRGRAPVRADIVRFVGTH